MLVLVHHVALALSIAGLGGAGLRVASLAAPRGLERAVAAAVLASAAAVSEALLLGLVGLGTGTVTLTLAACATWLAARQLPAPDPGPGRELADWWHRSPTVTRIAVGAAGGLLAAWAIWLLRYPALGTDSVLYHLPEALAWVHNGRPGSIEQVYALPGLPVGNYPLTNEVLLAWCMGIAHSFVPASLLAPAAMLLLAASGWLGLRELEVPPAAAALAIAAICATPVLTHWQRNGAYTDLPALAWLVAVAGLCAASRRRPALLAPALVAAGLAVGTKTTTLPLAAVVLGVALAANRRRLAGLGRPLALAAGLAAVAGGYWYLRNLVDHGSPFWPLVATSWGDPLPSSIAVYDVSFLDAPRTAIDRLGDRYLDLFAGGIALLSGALVAPFVARSRAVTGAACATAFALLLWANAPLTGETAHNGGVTTLRYLMPVLAAAAATLALAARAPGLRGGLATVWLAAALALGAFQTLDLGAPRVARPSTFVAGAALGALAAAIASRLPARLPPRGWPAALALIVVAGALSASAAFGYVERHAEVANVDGLRWLADRDDFRTGSQPVALAPGVYGPYAGDRLQHPLEAIRRREACASVTAREERGWVVINKAAFALPGFEGLGRCLRGERALFDGLYVVYRR